MAGRATKLTPEIQERIVEAIKTGMFNNRAALLAGVPERTFWTWIEKGRTDPDLEPRLTGVATKALRTRCRGAGIPTTTKTTRRQMITLLEEAGEGSWAIYRTFAQAVDLAEVELEQRLIAQVQHVALDSSNAKEISSFVNRRFRHWQTPTKVELSGPDGGPVEVEISEEHRIAEKVATFLRAREADVPAPDPVEAPAEHVE